MVVHGEPKAEASFRTPERLRRSLTAPSAYDAKLRQRPDCSILGIGLGKGGV